MSEQTAVRKITISLPHELVTFADRQAAEAHTSRSQVIGQALAHMKVAEEARLAAEGYRFFAQEAEEFAELTARASAEAWAAAAGDDYAS